MRVGADKAYGAREFVKTVPEMNVRPHIAQNTNRSGGSAIDRRTARHETYAVSQRKRPLIEKAFGWMKQMQTAYGQNTCLGRQLVDGYHIDSACNTTAGRGCWP